jgi:glycosyltransferase involved in cell wall biosynthesis
MSSDRSPQRVRVTHVVGQLHTGGMERLLVEFARHADRDRFELRFLCLDASGPVADDIAECGWPVECFGAPSGLRPGLAVRLARAFARARTDVVHTHNNRAHMYAGPAAVLSGLRPVIHTRHGQSVGTSRRHRFAFRLTTRFARRVVCVSEDAQKLSATEGIAARRLAVIRNGIDTERFAFAGPNPGGPLVMVGRLVPLKGVDTLLRALQQVARVRPEVRLEIAGDGEARPALVALSRELGLTDRVTFLGAVRDVPAVLGRAAALVLPSLSEGISLTLLEAMARGLPVVATSVGGNPEVVEHGATGLLVPPADPNALAAALLEVCDATDATRAMGRAGRARVESAFCVRRMVAEYEALYVRVLRRAPAVAAPESALSE